MQTRQRPNGTWPLTRFLQRVNWDNARDFRPPGLTLGGPNGAAEDEVLEFWQEASQPPVLTTGALSLAQLMSLINWTNRSDPPTRPLVDGAASASSQRRRGEEFSIQAVLADIAWD